MTVLVPAMEMPYMAPSFDPSRPLDRPTPDDVDALDLQIIARLRRDGRTSNRELSRILGFSEATIRRRVKALIDGGHIRIVAIADPYLLGYAIDVIIGVEVQPGTVREVAQGFSELENVRAVTITTGASDLVVAAIFRSNDDLLEFLSDDVGKIPGVIRTSTSHTIRVVKRSFDLFPEHLAWDRDKPEEAGGTLATDRP